MISRKRRRGSSLAAAHPHSSKLRWQSFATVWWMLAQVVEGQLSGLCLLCNDGSAPVQSNEPLPPLQFGGFGERMTTCNQMLLAARYERGSTPECERVQLAAFQAGCCAGIEIESSNDCGVLCPEGADPGLPFRPVPGPNGELFCKDLAVRADVQQVFLREFLGSPGDCEDTLLSRSSNYCGCPGSSGQVCSFCGSETTLLEDLFLPLSGGSCGDVPYQAALLRPDECGSPESYRRLWGFDPTPFCCPSGSPSAEQNPSCEVCPRGSLVPSRFVETERYGSVRCSEVAKVAAVGIATDEDCLALRQQMAGCCQGGDKNEHFDDGLPAVCRVCPKGETPIYPDRVLFSWDGQPTCDRLGQSLQASADQPENCQRILDGSRALQNCPCRPTNNRDDGDEAPNASPTTTNDGGGFLSQGSHYPSSFGLPLVLAILIGFGGWGP